MTHYLHVSSLCLCDGAIEIGTCGQPSGEALVDTAQLLREHADVVLQPRLLFLLLLDLTLQLLPLRAQFLNAYDTREIRDCDLQLTKKPKHDSSTCYKMRELIVRFWHKHINLYTISQNPTV